MQALSLAGLPAEPLNCLQSAASARSTVIVDVLTNASRSKDAHTFCR
jgi:hypothetical protein